MTALPHAFYPESSWLDDMQLGSAELALAAHRLGRPGRPLPPRLGPVRPALPRAPTPTDTLNLYDTGALADVSLAVGDGQDPHAPGRSPSPATTSRATCAPRSCAASGTRGTTSFGRRTRSTSSTSTPTPSGWSPRSACTTRLTHTDRYQRFATEQRTWLLGGDPWGVTAMVGVGHAFPNCMQHQVANLSGTLDGSPPLDVGAVVNGPNGKGNFEGGLGGFQTGMRHCTSAARHLSLFDGHGSRYVDDVRAWQTDEPALDMTGVGHHRRRGPAPPARPRASALTQAATR